MPSPPPARACEPSTPRPRSPRLNFTFRAARVTTSIAVLCSPTSQCYRSPTAHHQARWASPPALPPSSCAHSRACPFLLSFVRSLAFLILTSGSPGANILAMLPDTVRLFGGVIPLHPASARFASNHRRGLCVRHPWADGTCPCDVYYECDVLGSGTLFGYASLIKLCVLSAPFSYCDPRRTRRLPRHSYANCTFASR